MRLSVDCLNGADVRQALDFLNTLVTADLAKVKAVEDAPQKSQGISLVCSELPIPQGISLAEPAPELPDLGAPSVEFLPAKDVDLDSADLPWDKGLHSSGRTKMANGLWTPKRKRKSGVSKTSGYDDLLTLVSKCIANQSMAPKDLSDVCKTVGVATLPDLSARPGKIAEAFKLIDNRFNTPEGEVL